MANTAGPATFPGGVPVAQPHYLVDGNGNAASASNPQPVSQIVGGSPISATNPEINISNIQQLILLGQSFSWTTGELASLANEGVQFWVPSSSTKTVVLWSVHLGYSNASQNNQFQWLTTQDSNIATSVTPAALNMKAGGSAPSSGVALTTSASGAATPTGTDMDYLINPLNQTIELFSPGEFRVIPAGTTGGAGIAIYSSTTASGKYGVTVKWVEF